MGKQAPVSVVIPCYNVERYVAETLQSLVDQDMAPQEVIIVDDASEDGTLEAVKPYVDLLNITITSIEKGGQGVARNHGIGLASAPYVYFLDADDKLHPRMLSRVFFLLEKYSWPDLLFFSGRDFYDKDYTGSFKRNYRRKKIFPALAGDKAISIIGKDRTFSASPCMYISRRVLWGEGALKFQNIIHEDEEVLYPLILSSRMVVSVNDELFLRRMRNNSTMTSQKTQGHVNGREKNMISSLSLLRINNWSRGVKWALRKRVFWMSMSYFKVCHQTDIRFDIISTFRLLSHYKSPEVVLAFSSFFVVKRLKLLRK